ncbi:hypothetical protein LIER_16707 [Lithospermum erythrorhizon]|uniref:Secreted protein n=1 Tax=Lithospermum erythrorhizon TaxID=34254 RepID=A0AAV3Q7N7_LITER
MTAHRMLGEKGSNPANLVLVPCLVCPTILAERTSTCHRKAAMASWGGAGALHLLSRLHGDFVAPRLISPPHQGVWV